MRPGKFEGEADYVEWFWNLGLEGVSDMDNGELLGFIISPTDAFDFPELRKDLGKALVLHEDSNGFVYATLMSKRSAEEMINE